MSDDSVDDEEGRGRMTKVVDPLDEVLALAGFVGALRRRSDLLLLDAEALVAERGGALVGWEVSLLVPRQVAEASVWGIEPDQFTRVGKSGRPLALALPDPLPPRAEVVRVLPTLGPPLPHRHDDRVATWVEVTDGWRCDGCGVLVERAPR